MDRSDRKVRDDTPVHESENETKKKELLNFTNQTWEIEGELAGKEE